jgi:hypothetical protein
MKFLMAMILTLSTFTIANAEPTVPAGEPEICNEVDCICWYPGKVAGTVVRGAVIVTGKTVRGAAKVTGRVVRRAGDIVIPNYFKVTVAATDGEVVFYRVGQTERLLRARLGVNQGDGYLDVHDGCYKCQTRIPNAGVKSITIEKIR